MSVKIQLDAHAAMEVIRSMTPEEGVELRKSVLAACVPFLVSKVRIDDIAKAAIDQMQKQAREDIAKALGIVQTTWQGVKLNPEAEKLMLEQVAKAAQHERGVMDNQIRTAAKEAVDAARSQIETIVRDQVQRRVNDIINSVIDEVRKQVKLP